MAPGMDTLMSIEAGALYRLMTWLSPSYPIGAFSHSHGLEWAVGSDAVSTAGSLRAWIEDVLEHGSGRQDAILFSIAHGAVTARIWDDLAAIAELAAALNPSSERYVETMSQGRAFALATRGAWPSEADDGEHAIDPKDLAYPVAVAIAAGGHGIACSTALIAYLHAFSSNLVSAGTRLIPLGQRDGQAIIAKLEPVVHRVAERALDRGIDDLGGATLLADITSMRHETQYTRLFRT